MKSMQNGQRSTPGVSYRSVRYFSTRKQESLTVQPEPVIRFRSKLSVHVGESKRSGVYFDETKKSGVYLGETEKSRHFAETKKSNEAKMYETIAVTTACTENNTRNDSKPMTYLDTFHSLMLKPTKAQTEPIGNFFHSRPKADSNPRVHLTSYSSAYDESANSDLTLLDIFPKSYTSITAILNQVRGELVKDEVCLKEIGYSLKRLSEGVGLSLRDAEELALNKFSEFKAIICKDQVFQNQRKHRLKREIGLLHQTDQKMHNSIQNMQTTIFSCLPLELALNQHEGDQIQHQIYF